MKNIKLSEKKNFNHFIFILILLFINIGGIRAQSSEVFQQKKEPPPPEIQLEDYTIIGLDKVVLPHKERRSLFRKLNVNWSTNQIVLNKTGQKTPFRFYQDKPGFALSQTYPHIEGFTDYGSFSTFRINILGQINIKDLIPYFKVKYGKSDGHVDRADYKRLNINAGLNGNVWDNGVIQLTSRIQSDQQGLWSSLIPSTIRLKTETDFWVGYGILEQKFGDNTLTYFNGKLELLNFDNRFKYRQDVFSLGGGGKFDTGETTIFLDGKLDWRRSDRESRNTAAPDDYFLWDNQNSLYTGIGGVQWQSEQFSIAGGLQIQSVGFGNGNTKNETEFYPLIKLAYNQKETFSFFLKYIPGVEFQNMYQMVQAFPFSEFANFEQIKQKNYLTGGLTITSANVSLELTSSYRKAENYPVLFYHEIDSIAELQTQSSNAAYPFWEYNYIDDVSLLKNSFRFFWKINKDFNFEGLLLHNSSSIKTIDENNQAVSGNEIPYLPKFSGQLILDWFFMGNNKVRVVGDYVGKRYNEVSNSIQLDSYFLFNAKVDVNLTEYFTLYFYGNNLLDKNYDIYYTYIAPGINVGAGIRLRY